MQNQNLSEIDAELLHKVEQDSDVQLKYAQLIKAGIAFGRASSARQISKLEKSTFPTNRSVLNSAGKELRVAVRQYLREQAAGCGHPDLSADFTAKTDLIYEALYYKAQKEGEKAYRVPDQVEVIRETTHVERSASEPGRTGTVAIGSRW